MRLVKSSKNQTSVGAAESEGIGKNGTHLRIACDIWCVVQIALGVLVFQVDGGRNNLVLERFCAEDDFNHKRVARHLKQIDAAGGLVTLGAHGQLQGLGAHWEMWALTHGGMEAHNALKAATINGAEYLGMDRDLGSIAAGKLADIAVLDKNPLEQIENSDSVSLTVINGVVYDADSMNQLWPQQVERGKFYFQN